MEYTVYLRTCALAAVLGVWEGDWDSAGDSAASLFILLENKTFLNDEEIGKVMLALIFQNRFACHFWPHITHKIWNLETQYGCLTKKVFN